MKIKLGDPFVLLDPISKKYYCYGTNDEITLFSKKHFIIYESVDKKNWTFVDYAYSENENTWGLDWFWAPEVYFNPNNNLYYLFYSARVKTNLNEHYFDDPNYYETCKIGVLVSPSPRGPFKDLSNKPIEFFPYDEKYFDPYLVANNPFSFHSDLSKEKKIKLGAYIPTIDVNLFFDNGHIYMYLSRNAYKNCYFDHEFNRYIEESNIIAVELNTDWWLDKTGKSMPTIKSEYQNTYKGKRRDKYETILTYRKEPQEWENGNIFDFDTSNGAKTNRRWTEGSSIISINSDNRKIYCLFYSANHFESLLYAVGVAFSDSPLGPFYKYNKNPVIHLSKKYELCSSGHGSIVEQDDGIYYFFHARENLEDPRILCYTKFDKISFNEVAVSDLIKCETNE